MICKMTESSSIALFDMDGTLCDYEKGLMDALEEIRAPEESGRFVPYGDNPFHIQKRADLIRASGSWWENLPKFQLGWDVLEVAKELEFNIMILTQGPRKNSEAWAGKKRWIDKHLGENTDITITRDKGLVYGRVLVDDFPGYADKWLTNRPRGLVIMPASNYNANYQNPQVIRYNGTNLGQVTKALTTARDREEGEPLNLNGI